MKLTLFQSEMLSRLAILILTLFFAAANAGAQTVNALYQFSNYTLQPSSVRQITLTPLQPAGDYSGSILVPNPIIRVTDTNGSYTYSNVVAGYAYSIDLFDGAKHYTKTNFFPTGLTNMAAGYVNAFNYIGLFHGQIFAFFTATNFTFTTNYINITSNITNSYVITNNISGTNFGVNAGLNVTITTNGTSYTVVVTNQTFLTNGLVNTNQFSTGTNSVATNGIAALIATNTALITLVNAQINSLSNLMIASSNLLQSTKQPATLNGTNWSNIGTNQFAGTNFASATVSGILKSNDWQSFNSNSASGITASTATNISTSSISNLAVLNLKGYGTNATFINTTNNGNPPPINNTTTGQAAESHGSGTTASGMGSFAGGLSSTASGQSSVAMGNTVVASGGASAAFGNNNMATNTQTFVVGSASVAGGYNSSAIGYICYALGNYSISMGAFSIANGLNSFIWSDGNGGTNSTANSFVVMASGGIGLGTTSAGSYKVNVGGSLNASNLYINGVLVATTNSVGSVAAGTHTTVITNGTTYTVSCDTQTNDMATRNFVTNSINAATNGLVGGSITNGLSTISYANSRQIGTDNLTNWSTLSTNVLTTYIPTSSIPSLTNTFLVASFTNQLATTNSMASSTNSVVFTNQLASATNTVQTNLTAQILALGVTATNQFVRNLSGSSTNQSIYSGSGANLFHFYLTNGAAAGFLSSVSGTPKWFFIDGGHGYTINDTNSASVFFASADNVAGSGMIGSISASNVYGAFFIGDLSKATNVSLFNTMATNLTVWSNLNLNAFTTLTYFTNSVGIFGCGVAAARGEYDYVGGGVWTNLAFNGSAIVFQNPTYFLQTNNVNLYSASSLQPNSVWLAVIGSTAVPTNSGFGMKFDFAGLYPTNFNAGGLAGLVPMKVLDTTKIVTNNESASLVFNSLGIVQDLSFDSSGDSDPTFLTDPSGNNLVLELFGGSILFNGEETRVALYGTNTDAYFRAISGNGLSVTNIAPSSIRTNGSTAGQYLSSVGGRTVWTNFVATTTNVINGAANNTVQTNVTIYGFTLGNTNSAPVDAVTPKIWFAITNNGQVYMVEGFQ